jgi:type IV secretion system protein VirB10
MSDIAEPDTDAVAPPPKAPPEALVMRANPRRVVRFKRGVVIGGTAAGSAVIVGIAWLALAHHPLHIAPPTDDGTTTNHTAPAEVVTNLPGNYGKVPQLGPPLPGDLGPSILQRQRELAAGGAAPPAPTTMTPGKQAAEAERQRLVQQAQQARESGVLVRTSARPATNAEAPAAPAVTPTDTAAADKSGKLDLDPHRDQNAKQRKLDFVSRNATDGIYDGHEVQTPASPYEVMAGSIISASLITGVDSDLPGTVIAQVTENVFDTVTGRILLIPQGSRLIGQYDSVVAYGQKRALLVWQRIILPDGSSIQIDNLPATDPSGYAGLADKVDFHTWQLLKGVALSTLLGIGTQISIGSDQSDLIRAIRESAQQSTSEAGERIVMKQLDVQPTLKVRPGWPLRVIVHKDLVLRKWTGQ